MPKTERNRKTCPCNVYPHIPLFYIVEMGFTGVYVSFLFLLQNIDCGYSLEQPKKKKKKKKKKNFSTIYHLSQMKKLLCIAWASFRNVYTLEEFHLI